MVSAHRIDLRFNVREIPAPVDLDDFEILELLVVLTGEQLVLLLDKVSFLVAGQVLLCLIVDQLLLKLGLETLGDHFPIKRHNLVQPKGIKPLCPLLE